ncbi:MAG: hydrogenase maturation protease [Actinobacteria bacterium]|nr:hydrogenase maturation protease [Actinomycetota bacterium]
MSCNHSDSSENFISGANYKIIGFGNIFMSDDGIGIKVIEELRKESFTSKFNNISIIDGGTSAVDLLFMLENSDKVIIVDAVDAGQNTGEIVRFKLNEIAEFKKKNIKSFSLHDVDLSEAFNLMKSLNMTADITIIGIKPKIVDYGEKLSPEIESKIPELILKIKQEMNL